MTEVDKRFDERFQDEYQHGDWFLVIGKDLKAFIHQELRNQAKEIIEELEREFQRANDSNFAGGIVHAQNVIKKYLSD